MAGYEVPEEIVVEADGAVRIVRLNRPDALNAANHALHRGLADLWPQVDADAEARVVVLTGAGRAFSAGGDLDYISRQIAEPALRQESLSDGRRIVEGMVACRVPIIASVNGPAVGLGCSLVALSDITYMADDTYLADPHVALGLVAGDGGAMSWPLLISLSLAKEYALTGERIPAARAAAIGLVNHVCPAAEVMGEALAAARRIAALPPGAVQDTRRVMNLYMQRSVVAALEPALAAEYASFDSPQLRENVERYRQRP